MVSQMYNSLPSCPLNTYIYTHTPVCAKQSVCGAMPSCLTPENASPVPETGRESTVLSL